MAEARQSGLFGKLIGGMNRTMRRVLFAFLSTGPIPEHMAFIMDGNRRFAKKWKLEEGAGHKAGFLALMSILKYFYEAGVKYITVYAFSLDNFKRRPDEVKYVMDMMLEKIQGFFREMHMVNQYGVRVLFIGDLSRLDESVRVAAEKAMEATAKNTKTYLLVCVAYTSSHEILQAIQEACQEKRDAVNQNSNNDDNKNDDVIKMVDLEKHMYMGVVPDPDVLVRSSGETRLSNFLLWQSTNSLLYSPKALWPEMGFWHVVWGILKYQINCYYLEKQKKQA